MLSWDEEKYRHDVEAKVGENKEKNIKNAGALFSMHHFS
jgi:hypothetical protein